MKFRYDKRIAFILSILVLTVVIFVNLYSIFYKPANLPFKLFNRYALPGPFFTEERIQTVPQMNIRIKRGESWGVLRNYEKEFFMEYHSNPLRYDHLVQSNFLRASARLMARRVNANSLNPKNDSVFVSKFSKIIKDRNPEGTIDSVAFVYMYHSYMPRLYMTRKDTVFRYVTKMKNQ